ncbi:MAG TPA: SIS domain-containing protein [Caldilineaceae bacterium]|nr:SIS domain-containing protein [Caldilineaceae bacterium]
MTRGQHTLAEINSQPEVWAEAVAYFRGLAARSRQAWAALQPRQVVVTGCGSTYYLAQVAAALLQGLTGIPARGAPASEILFFPEQVIHDPAGTLLLVVSRSGTTTESVAAMEKFRRLGGKAIWGITCYGKTPVAVESDLTLLAEMAQEQSVAQTRSFSTMLLLAQGAAAAAAGQDLSPLERLPRLCRELLDGYGALGEQLATAPGHERFFFLGSGPQYGVACEAMLKMKEMSITHSEAYHFLEFRHGPKALVDEQTVVAGLLSGQARAHEATVLREMGEMGAKTLALAPGGLAGEEEPGRRQVALPEELPAWCRPALYLPILQRMGYARAIHKGLDPDNPRNLSAVIYLDPAGLV